MNSNVRPAASFRIESRALEDPAELTVELDVEGELDKFDIATKYIIKR
jgi:hypothetical protein